MVAWPRGEAEVCKTFYSGSNPLATSKTWQEELILLPGDKNTPSIQLWFNVVVVNRGRIPVKVNVNCPAFIMINR